MFPDAKVAVGLYLIVWSEVKLLTVTVISSFHIYRNNATKVKASVIDDADINQCEHPLS